MEVIHHNNCLAFFIILGIIGVIFLILTAILFYLKKKEVDPCTSMKFSLGAMQCSVFAIVFLVISASSLIFFDFFPSEIVKVKDKEYCREMLKANAEIIEVEDDYITVEISKSKLKKIEKTVQSKKLAEKQNELKE